MSPNLTLSTLPVLLFFTLMVGIGVYLLVLLARYVSAQKRGAIALETIANQQSALAKNQASTKR